MENINKLDAKFDLILIEGVRRNKCLYDKRDAFYFNKLKKEKAWKAIAEESKRTDPECRLRWKALRERYSRELRKLNQPSGSGASEYCVWELMEEMCFLKDSMQPRKTISNEIDENIEAAQFFSDDGGATAEDFCTATASSKKRKTAFDGLCEKFGKVVEKLDGSFIPSHSITDDGDEEFVSSIIAMTRALPPDAKDAYKIEMLTRVTQLRRQYRSFGSI
ncbi:transcription factor Adf-1-like isoform X2 [Eupeodes corollae]|uniref:transcription factor Adf-1-like isoform X2 n=1 Tax=Eupeodes corollae TaxID=290404 RepID=UPI002491E82B|nr:transcription factor Adf-1-like isoform X2 [Eupeodes corollae]